MPRLLFALDSATGNDAAIFAVRLDHEAAGLAAAVSKWANGLGWEPDDPEAGFTFDDLEHVAKEEIEQPGIAMARLLHAIIVLREAAAMLRRLEPRGVSSPAAPVRAA